MKNIYIYLIGGSLTVGLVFLGFFLLSGQGGKTEGEIGPDQTVLYYGDTCPHCLIVNEYLEKNKVSEKVKFEHLEVYKNADNAKKLKASAEKCGIKSSEIGVPLLWAEGKCLVGDEDIIDFFKKKTGSKD